MTWKVVIFTLKYQNFYFSHIHVTLVHIYITQCPFMLICFFNSLKHLKRIFCWRFSTNVFLMQLNNPLEFLTFVLESSFSLFSFCTAKYLCHWTVHGDIRMTMMTSDDHVFKGLEFDLSQFQMNTYLYGKWPFRCVTAWAPYAIFEKLIMLWTNCTFTFLTFRSTAILLRTSHREVYYATERTEHSLLWSPEGPRCSSAHVHEGLPKVSSE